MPKTAAKKGSKRAGKKAARKRVRTITTLPAGLSAAQKREAERCLERSGRIVVGFKDISVSRLPARIKPAMTVKD